MSKNVPLENTGTFLFHAPTKLSIHLNKDCVMVFTLPRLKASAVFLWRPDMGLQHVPNMLDGLLSKVKSHFKVSAGELKVKWFGLSDFDKRAYVCMKQWMRARGLTADVEDLGRNIHRMLQVDCGTGQVGVQYAEPGKPAAMEFLTKGSAATRIRRQKGSLQVLVVSSNPVEQQLTSQAVEEHSNCEVTTVKKPKELFAKKLSKAFKWDLVLMSTDAIENAVARKWMLNVVKMKKSVRFASMGETDSFNDLFSLPTVDPEKLREFKHSLSNLLANPEEWSQVSSLLMFKKAKKKTPARRAASR